MSDEKITNLKGVESPQEQEGSSVFNLANIYAMLVLNWQWFLLSLVICVSGALIYLRYATPVYQVSVKMLIKDDDTRGKSSANLATMQELGFITTSEGIVNEVEILHSNILGQEVVKNLKLYAEYKTDGHIKKNQIYGTQPVTVDLDEEHLNALDTDLLDGVKQIQMQIVKLATGYAVAGKTLLNGQEQAAFEQTVESLPCTIQTPYGTLTLSKNPKVKESSFANGQKLYVNIQPSMLVARSYMRQLTVAPSSKQTSIAILTFTNTNTKRAIDFLQELVRCYNAQANTDKNEIALKTEEFINSRIEKIDAELGSTETDLENFKRRNEVTQLNADAAQSLQMSTEYANKLAEANSQIQLLEYLREYVDNPENQYKIIPSNVGMSDNASTALISNYNQAVQERNRLLKSASEQAPQVLTLTSALDELQGSIRTALLQARRSAEIQRQGLQSQYAKYQGRIGSTPEQERVLNQIGRQQEVKSGLYLLLLQKREENSISLAATADKGKLIDEPAFEGQISPKNSIILLMSIVLGLGIPFLIICLIRLLSYRIEGHEDITRLTRLPLVSDIPVASENVKNSAGIVVQANRNNQIDEIFRSMRTNIQFMLKENEKVVLFTSTTSGEGKTFLAANLAVSFALLGKKVVLCGLDIRKPALGRLFGVKDHAHGISQLLVKEHVTSEDLAKTLCPSGIDEHLDLLMAGPTPPNPTELLARENLSQILELLQQQYDYVILDTAPVGLVSDTLQIARYANVCCYVCRADYTPKSSITMLNELTEQEKLVNPCVILNGVDMSKKKNGYYYGYGRYGKYGRYGSGYGGYGSYGSYGNYAESNYGNKNDDSIKK